MSTQASFAINAPKVPPVGRARQSDDAGSTVFGDFEVGDVGNALGTDALLLGCMILAILALAAILGTIRERRTSRQLARDAKAQSDGIRELLRTMRLAESMVGVGVWQYLPKTDRQLWSDGLKRLFGIERDAELVEGDAEAMLYANGTDLVGMVKAHEHEVQPFNLQVEILGFDGVTCTISLQACNMRATDGSVQRVVAILRDVTGAIESGSALTNLDGTHGLKSNAPDDEDTDVGQVDPLTGLFTRRAVMHKLDRLVVEARKQGMPLAVVMFDVDHLKRVNDKHGRECGDQTLQKVARVAKEQARIIDPLGRMGGEEFVWIIPGANEGMARVMTERMRQAIAKGSAAGAVGPVTISLGYAVMQDGDTPLSLFARADNALYAAMNSGRNRVRAAA